MSAQTRRFCWDVHSWLTVPVSDTTKSIQLDLSANWITSFKNAQTYNGLNPQRSWWLGQKKHHTTTKLKKTKIGPNESTQKGFPIHPQVGLSLVDTTSIMTLATNHWLCSWTISSTIYSPTTAVVTHIQQQRWHQQKISERMTPEVISVEWPRA